MTRMNRVLFVGIGGSGSAIGLELEEQLRRDLCGRDGRRLLDNGAFRQAERYQLPDFVRTVYIDLDTEEIPHLASSSLASPSAVRASRRTLRNLMPPSVSYPAVAAKLRTGATRAVSGWLPPASAEPRVSPLSAGAGQFPTVGRAALYEMLRARGAHSTLLGPIMSAIAELDRAEEQLNALTDEGNFSSDVCEVFVAFSVAGGTGCGLFLDVLHIVEHCFAIGSHLDLRIHPIVALPSSFDPQHGGGVEAYLNGAPALVDIARYTDAQNAGSITEITIPEGGHRDRVLMTRGVGLAPAAFVFSRPPTHSPQDHVRAIAGFIRSRVGPSDEQFGRSGLNYAQVGVNRSKRRSRTSQQRIGLRPFTVAYSGSMSVPVDELSRLLGDTILATAVDALLPDLPEVDTPAKDTEALEAFKARAGLNEVLAAQPLRDLPRYEGGVGAERLNTELTNLRSQAAKLADTMADTLSTDVERARFDWRAGLEAMADLGVDPFQARRVVRGNPGDGSEVSLNSDLKAFAEPPAAIPAPEPSQLRNHPLGFALARYRMTTRHPRYQRERGAIDQWYKHRCRAIWRQYWADRQAIWGSAFVDLHESVSAVADELTAFAGRGSVIVEETYSELFQRRHGVVHYVPGVVSARSLGDFTRRALDVIYGSQGGRPGLEATTAAAIVRDLGGWHALVLAAADGRRSRIRQELNDLRSRLAELVEQVLRTPQQMDRPLLPPLANLLERAADGVNPEGDDEPQQVTNALKSVVRASTDLPADADHVVVSYPVGDDRNREAVEDFLRHLVSHRQPESAAIDLVPSTYPELTISCSKSEFGLLDVPEIVRCLQTWDGALRNPMADDDLWWRQRTGYDNPYLLTSRNDQVEILFSLLNGLWAGLVQFHVDGAPNAPIDNITVFIDHPEVLDDSHRHQVIDGPVRIVVPRSPLDELTPWHGFITAYERCVLRATEPERQVLSRWLDYQVPGIGRSDPARLSPPSEFYHHFCRMIELDQGEVGVLRTKKRDASTGIRRAIGEAEDFLGILLPEARNREFGGEPGYKNHAELARFFPREDGPNRYE